LALVGSRAKGWGRDSDSRERRRDSDGRGRRRGRDSDDRERRRGRDSRERRRGRGRGLAREDTDSCSDSDSWSRERVALRGWQTGGARGSKALGDLGPVQVVEVGYVRVATLGVFHLLVVLDAGADALVLRILALALGLEPSGCPDVTRLAVGFTLRLLLSGLTRRSFNRGLLTAKEKHFQDFKASCGRRHHTKRASQRSRHIATAGPRNMIVNRKCKA
jgi:hypothetical protein